MDIQFDDKTVYNYFTFHNVLNGWKIVMESKIKTEPKITWNGRLFIALLYRYASFHDERYEIEFAKKRRRRRKSIERRWTMQIKIDHLVNQTDFFRNFHDKSHLNREKHHSARNTLCRHFNGNESVDWKAKMYVFRSF